MRKTNKLFAMLFAMLGVGTLSAQTDVTSTYLTNADLSSLDGWTRTEYTDWKTDGDANVIEFYHTWSASAGAAIGSQKDFYFKQTATLPAGEYRLAVNAFYREGNGDGTNTKAYIFAGEQQQYIVGLNSGALSSYTGTNDLYKAANAFSNGAFSNAFDFTVAEETTMELGFSGYIDTYCSWCILGPVKLYQYSMDDFNDELTAARTKLQEISSELIDSDMKTRVSQMLTDTESVTQTKADILEATAKVNALYDEAVESVETYAAVLSYITKANSIDTSIAADYQTQYNNGTITETAEVVFQNLEVATYNYVTSNFTYDVALSDTWNAGGTNTQAATFSNEHWSGETHEYKNQDDTNGQGWNASAWSIDFDQEVTLPAGEYVFKVAGRKSADATLELVVTQGETELGTVNDFPSSNSALGINKAGAASFDANDEAGFANNGSGYGWQWRYVKFTLDAEATVKVAVHAETSVKYNWVSFGDYTLQMTEETYLNANQSSLATIEATAQELANTTVMGDAERAALNTALAMTYTTGAEMKAKTDALNTAITNANAWVAAYDAAKAPLVAALERFETYNDEENGAKDHMATSRWETVVAKAEAAAVAKDVTNSYEGFATATQELTDALDAADTSIAEYAALKEAIDNANALASSDINWGDQPFQKPESGKESLNASITDAQAVYDAATADGEGVTSATTALNTAIGAANALTLNAPAAGQSFYLTVATAGHTYEGYPIIASLGTTGENNPTGYGYAATTTNTTTTKLYTFTQVEGNKYNISFEMDGATVYLTYGSLNGSAAGWSTQQIQGTTVTENKGEFEIEASATTEGAIKIRNTVTGTYLDCQDNGPIYTDDAITNDEFLPIERSTELSADIEISADNMLATCVLQFNATLPTGLQAYVCSGYADGYLILELVEDGVLPAYTPCLLYAAEGITTTLTGTIVMDGYAATVTGSDALLYGAIKATTITEGYVLQNQGSGAKFYSVNGISGTVPAGKCWLDASATSTTAASVGLSFRGGGATSLNEIEVEKPALENGVIYTIDGKRVNSMERGKIYIINGQKVLVK